MTRFDGLSTPIFIVCRDKLEQLRLLLAWLEGNGYTRIILVDNNSSFPPLLEYLERSPHAVVRLKENLGPHVAVWGSGVLETYASSEHYVVTDSDVLPDPECPPDAVDFFHHVLKRYPDYCKSGFALRVDDLPQQYALAQEVKSWEEPFWRRKLENGLYHAVIDTTFALYRPNSGFAYGPSIRTGRPYWAKHQPWYSHSDNPTEEEAYYRTHARPGVAHWDLDGQVKYALPPKMTLRERVSWPLHSALKVRRDKSAKWPRTLN